MIKMRRATAAFIFVCKSAKSTVQAHASGGGVGAKNSNLMRMDLSMSAGFGGVTGAAKSASFIFH